MIQFAHPLALLGLLSIPTILVLYSLRPTRRKVVVSTNTLWSEALRDRQRGLGLQKLLRDLSLLLLLLVALVVSLGLADPQWLTRSAEGNDIVVVLDVSASMKSRSEGTHTRFTRAKREVAALIDSLPRDGRMLIMTSGRNPVLRSSFESERERLRRQLAELEPTDEAGRPRQALALALSLLRNRARGRIYFFTDGAFDENVDFGSPRVEYRRVGGPARNVAITQFDLRPEVGTQDRFQVLLTVRNYTGQAVRVPASVTVEGNPLLEETFGLAPGEKKTLVLPFRGRVAGRAHARVDFDDDLAADNEAFAVVPAYEGLRVLLFGDGNNFYLRSLFQALPEVTVTELDIYRDDLFPDQLLNHDVVVFDGLTPPELPPGSYLLIDTIAPGLPFAGRDWISNPVIEGRGDSALVQHLDLSGVTIDRARPVKVDTQVPGLQRLFWSKDADLALALLEDDLRLVFIGFDITRSSFPLQAAFPLFLRESLAWLHPGVSREASTQVAAGTTHTIQLPVDRSELIVHTPSGRELRHEVDGGQVLFDTTRESGFYQYMTDEFPHYFAVNLTDEQESDITPRAVFSEAQDPAQESSLRSQVAKALWPYLTGLALLALMLEWCLGCWRRSSA